MSSHAIGSLLALFGVFCFAIRPIFVRLVYGHGVDPTTLLFLRLGLSVVLDFPASTVASRARMRTLFEAAGVAGLFIGDQVFPNRCGYLPGKQIIPAEQMLAKVKAMLDARRDPDLFIVARTDAASIEGQDAAIERLLVALLGCHARSVEESPVRASGSALRRGLSGGQGSPSGLVSLA